MRRLAVLVAVSVVVLGRGTMNTEQTIFAGVVIAIVIGALGWLGDAPGRFMRWRLSRRDWLPDNVTLEYICGLRRGQTEVTGDRLVEPYAGKWTYYTGTVTDVRKAWPGYKVSCQREKPNIFLNFKGNKAGKSLDLMPIGATITVAGRVGSVFDGFMALNECELVVKRKG